MPPRRRRQQAEAPAAPEASLSGLPPDVLQMIGSHLVAQDKLGSPETAAQDIASLAMSSRALNDLAKGTLWRLLGEEYPEEGATTAKALAAVPKQDRWDARHLTSNTRKLKNYTAAKALARQYAEEVPDEVPAHIFGEVARLRCLGLAATNAKKEFQLTDKELRGVERVDKSRGSMGTAHIHALSGLVRAAQAKHGSVEGMAAAMRERAAKRERAAASKQEAADARRQALALAAGLEDISADVASVGCIARYLRTPNAKGAPTQHQLVPFVQLVDWAMRHTALRTLSTGFDGPGRLRVLPALRIAATSALVAWVHNRVAAVATSQSGGCCRHSLQLREEVTTSEQRFLNFKIHFRDDCDEDGGGYFNDYFSQAQQAAAELSSWEEDDCIRLACQNWARCRGGMRAALALPEAPPEGPLRDALSAVLCQGIASDVAYDAGWDHQFGMAYEYWDNAWESEDNEEASDVYRAGTSTFFGDFTYFIQVELSARSGDALDALQARVRPNLCRLASYAAPPADSLRAEACLVAFEAPTEEAGHAGGVASEAGGQAAEPPGQAAQREQVQAGQLAAGPGPAAEGAEPAELETEGGAPGALHCLFYVGVAEKEDPASLLTGGPYRSHGNEKVTLGNVEQTVGRWFEEAWKANFEARQPGMAVRLRLLPAQQVPASVRQAAADA